MKLKLFFITLLFFPLPAINAQCKDCFPTENDWKFAAGVTLYSNNLYVYNENLLERQPLEFNFRYKLAPNHILRLSSPIALKTKITKDPQYTEINYALDGTLENKALAYLDGLKHDAGYSEYYKVNDYYYNLFGASIGYDYSLNLSHGISLSAGFDLSFYYYQVNDEYFDINYSILDANNMSQLNYLTYVKITNDRYAYSLKPFLAICYKFQNLLIEGNVGYSGTISKFHADMLLQDINMVDNHSTNDRNYNFNKMVFQLSLFYSL